MALFKKSKARCKNCGHTWNVLYLNIRGGEKKLSCPRCKKRNSEVVK